VTKLGVVVRCVTGQSSAIEVTIETTAVAIGMKASADRNANKRIRSATSPPTMPSALALRVSRSGFSFPTSSPPTVNGAPPTRVPASARRTSSVAAGGACMSVGGGENTSA
jgi:hypothetical protein